MRRLKYITIYSIAILLLGCNDAEYSFTDYLNGEDETLRKEYVLDFEKALGTIDKGHFLILRKNEEGFFLDKSDYSKSYPDRKSYDIYLGNNDSTLLFDFEVYSFNQIDSIVNSNIEKHSKDRTTKGLGVIYDLILPENENRITSENSKVGLKLIRKISDSYNSFSGVYPTFFIFKRDYDEPIPKPN